MTIKEWYSNLASHVDEKATSPFFAALTFTWLVHNWPLIYSLFTFHDDMSRQAKMAWIEKYIREDQGEILWVIQVDHFHMLYSPIVWALGVILIYPAFNNLALAINTGWVQYVRLFILKKMDNRKVVARERYQRKVDRHEDLKKEFQEYIEIFDTYRETKEKTDAELKKKVVEYENLNKQLTDARGDNSDLHNDKRILERKVEKLQDYNDEVGSQIKAIARHTSDTHVAPSRLFEGIWTKEFKTQEGETRTESFEVHNDNRYYLEGAKTAFHIIKDLGMDNGNKTLAFRKEALDGSQSILIKLSIDNANEFSGTEYEMGREEIEVKYTKRGF